MSYTLALIAVLQQSPQCSLIPNKDKRGQYQMVTQEQLNKRINCPVITVPKRADLTLKKAQNGCYIGQDTMSDFKLCKVKGIWYFFDTSEDPNKLSNLRVPLDKYKIFI